MPSTGNPWLERNQREEKVAVKQSQALQHQMPFIHTLLLSILLFFLCVHLSSCREKHCGAGKNPWDESSGHGRQSPIGRPYSPLHFPDKHLLWGLSIAPNSGLGMPIRGGEQGPGPNSGRVRSLGAWRQSESLWQRQTTGQHWGTLFSLSLLLLLLICTCRKASAGLQQRQKMSRKRKAGEESSPYVAARGWMGKRRERGDCESSLLLFCCIFTQAFSFRATTVKQKLFSLVSNFFSTRRLWRNAVDPAELLFLAHMFIFLHFRAQKQVLGHVR